MLRTHAHALATTSAVASTRARRPRAFGTRPATPLAFLSSPAQVVSDVATAVLKTPLVLKRYTAVRCDVDLAFDGALTGKVNGVKIRGERWSSPRELTCESISFDVGACELDIGAALSMQGIKLVREAKGCATLVFDSRDFGNFLAHPLFLASSRLVGVGGSKFTFDKSTARVSADGCLEYTGTWARDGVTRAIRMFPGENGSGAASLRVQSQTPNDDALERALEVFFTTLVIDLEGTELLYRDMTIDRTRERVRFNLDVTVKRFPSPNLQF
jgi:hypothetical protein